MLSGQFFVYPDEATVEVLTTDFSLGLFVSMGNAHITMWWSDLDESNPTIVNHTEHSGFVNDGVVIYFQNEHFNEVLELLALKSMEVHNV